VGAPEPATLLSIAESIADGAPVDWNALVSAARPEDRATLRHLRIIAELATLHRTMPVLPQSLPTAFVARRSSTAPAIGSWAHLDLIERIGGGSFGEVYRAWDRHLEREVALKLLHQDDPLDDPQASRITTEGRLLARVHHPNVVTVHGVAVHDGRVGLWMELVHGATLEQVLSRQGSFSAREATGVGIDLCRALAAIHKARLIHRDVKAQNVLREDGGRIVLMDLGTGREMVPAGMETLSDLAGTPLYLAPEIFAGAPASEGTDLYSLGVLLYRLVTRSFPVHARTFEEFKGAHASGARTRLRDERPDLPSSFVRVVDRAISADPGERYVTAGALESDLVRSLDDVVAPAVPQPAGSGTVPPWYLARRSWIAAAAMVVLSVLVSLWALRYTRSSINAQAIRSIAVLPLVNLSGDPSQEYFADGMTEALIDRLARVRALRVISRTSSMQFKQTTKSLAEIARALNVDAVLEGSIRRVGSRVQISADLVHVASDRHVWVESYDRDVKDLLALQTEVAQTIARAIQIQLTPVELAGFGAVSQVSPAAEEAYLQGRYYWNKRTNEGYQKALDYFRQASSIDPSFARAYAGQADVYNLLPGRLAPATAYPLAKDAAHRALSLDPTLAEAHTSLAFATFIFDRDWTSAEAGFQRAVQYKPGYATAHHWYGDYLSAMGRHDEAIYELQTAKSLDPLSSAIRGSLGDAFYMARRSDEAIAEYQNALDIDAGNPSLYLYMALTYATIGRLNEANEVVEQGIARAGASPTMRLAGASIAALRGDRAGATRTVEEIAARGREIYVLGNLFAYVYICLGDVDRALLWLERGEQAGAPGILWANVEPTFDSVRGDQRFVELLRRLRLVA
jgi:TolB-like protein/Tfp pilus assembly protein PilF